MITKTQSKAYAAITLDLLYKMKLKVNPESLAEQMNYTFDLYEPDEIENIYKTMIDNNKIIKCNTSGKANCYIVNTHNSIKNQVEIARKFCNQNIELGKIYVAPPGENADDYYELIKDIRNKNMDILLLSIFTILGMSEREFSMVKHLCRENEIVLIEI